MNAKQLTPIGCGFTRTTYRRLFWKLFRITQSGPPEIMLGFKATRLFGNFWWVDMKSFRAYCDRYHGTFERVEITTPEIDLSAETARKQFKGIVEWLNEKP